MDFSVVNNSISDALDVVAVNSSKMYDIRHMNDDAFRDMDQSIHEWFEENITKWEKECSPDFNAVNDSISKALNIVGENHLKTIEMEHMNDVALRDMDKLVHEWLKENETEWEKERSHYNFGTIMVLLWDMEENFEFEDVESFKDAIDMFCDFCLYYTVGYYFRTCENIEKADFDGNEISFTAKIDGSWVDGTITVRNGMIETKTHERN